MAEQVQVAVTGASGYIALHVIAELLDAGHAVRGTLRDMGRADAIRAALSRQTETSNLSFAKCDLMSDDGWDEAFTGCRYVIHVASPAPIAEPKDHDDLIIPARDGALRALGAASRAGVKRVVMTSSVAAIGYGHDGKSDFTEADWSNEERHIGAYAASKTIAERAAWNFIKALPNDGAMELVTINPSIVLGPLIDPNGCSSTELIRRLLVREVPGCPKIGVSLVDVRDVAAAHITAMTAPKAAGNRYICNTEVRWIAQIAEQLNHDFEPRGYPVSMRLLPNFMVRLVGLFDAAVRRAVPELGQRKNYINDAIRKDLNWQSRAMDLTVKETGESLLALKVI